MTQEELNVILKNHKKWLQRIGGERANLSGADLCGVDLRFASLRGADLRDVHLNCANLRYADLRYVCLNGAELNGVNMRYADLRYADIRYADIRYAYLSGANLNGANLSGVRYNEQTAHFAMQCPEKGSYIGYKKAQNSIVELQITEDSKRSSATTRKCRASKVKVLSITSLNGKKFFDKAVSDYDSSFVYKVGETIEVKDFDENRWSECSTGIHHFITREEAVFY